MKLCALIHLSGLMLIMHVFFLLPVVDVLNNGSM